MLLRVTIRLDAFIAFALGLLLTAVSAVAASSPERILPTYWCGSHIMVTAHVGGDSSRALTLILDTGSTHNIIDPESLQRVSPNSSLVEGDSFTFKQLNLGEVKLSKVPGWLKDLDHLSTALGHSIDGIIGYPTFKSTVLTFDYPAKQVRLSIKPDPLPRSDDVLKLKHFRRRPWITLRVGNRNVATLIDSGSSRGFSVQTNPKLKWKFDPVAVSTLTGFTRLEKVTMGRLVNDLTLGSTCFTTPAVREISRKDIPSLGEDVLRHFVVTIDGPRHRIHFAPGDSVKNQTVSPEPHLGLGVGWQPHPESLEVVSLVPGGPGEKAGLQNGDHVITINGKPISEFLGCDPAYRTETNLTVAVRRSSSSSSSEFTTQLTRAILVP